MNISKGKKTAWKGYDSNYMASLKRQNNRDDRRLTVNRGLGREGLFH